MVKEKEQLQNELDKKRLNLEVLLQTLTVKKNDYDYPDVELTIRLHDKVSKEHVDLFISSKNKFKDIYICNRRCQENGLIFEIFKYMTMTIGEINSIISSTNPVQP